VHHPAQQLQTVSILYLEGNDLRLRYSDLALLRAHIVGCQ
jgi:hypothetical protein